MKRWHFIVMVLGMTLAMSSCMHMQNETWQRAGQWHNQQGGYIEACDELPGMLGDDC